MPRSRLQGALTCRGSAMGRSGWGRGRTLLRFSKHEKATPVLQQAPIGPEFATSYCAEGATLFLTPLPLAGGRRLFLSPLPQQREGLGEGVSVYMKALRIAHTLS